MVKLAYWVLTYEECMHSRNGETVDNIRTQSFLDLGEAEDARYYIEEGILDKLDDLGAGITFRFVGLEHKECDLEEEG